MDELDRRLTASRYRLRDRITPPSADRVIARARRRRTQRRAGRGRRSGRRPGYRRACRLVVRWPAPSSTRRPGSDDIHTHRSDDGHGDGNDRPVTVHRAARVVGTAIRGCAEHSAAPAPVTAATTVGTGQPILGIGGGYELFARSAESVARIQFARGPVTVKPAPAIQSGAGAYFFVGSHAVIARAWDREPGYLLPDDGPATDHPPALSGGGNTFPGPQPGPVWIPASTDNAKPGVDTILQLVDFDGTKTASLPMSGSPLAPDGNGYVLVRGANCLYDVHTDGRVCIATGASLDLVAAGPTGWLLHPCAQGTQCNDVYIDRATGVKRQTSADIDPQQPGVISPDGSYAAALDASPAGVGATTLHLVDLSTGADRTVKLPSSPDAVAPTYGSALTWSPDGRWLFLAAGQIIAVDPATGHATTLTEVPAGDGYIQVAIRPAATDKGGT